MLCRLNPHIPLTNPNTNSRYRARCRLLTTGLAFAAALAASLALIGAGIHSTTDPSTVLNPSALEEKDPEHGYPFPPPPPPSGEGPIHPPSIPTPGKGEGGEGAAGNGKGAAGKEESGARTRRELRQPEIRYVSNDEKEEAGVVCACVHAPV